MPQAQSWREVPWAALPRAIGGVRVEFPLIQAVVNGLQEGLILTNGYEPVSSGLVITKFGFVYAFGRDEEDRWKGAVDRLFTHPRLKGRYLLWYDPPPLCRQVLDSLPDGVAKARTRIRFRFEPKGGLPSLPPGGAPEGVQILRIERPLFPKLTHLKLDLATRFWRSERDFIDKGVGFVAVTDGQAVSICYSACVVNNTTEIDVATADTYRGRGLASAVSQAFLRHCRREGLVPSWDCFDYNVCSYRLAVGLGFREARRYPFYSLNT